jgi:hypothetical protein
MKKDALHEYNRLRENLISEREQLQTRLQQISEALGEPFGRRATRFRNKTSLKAAVLKLTSERPLTKTEILEELQKMEYVFTTNNPVNSLNVVLYGKSPRFRNDKGHFSPMKR